MKQFIDNDPAKQQARAWSERLDTLAAENATAPVAGPTRLSTILQHLRQRNRPRQQIKDDLNAQHFIMAD
jgi:hypothetical protein